MNIVCIVLLICLICQIIVCCCIIRNYKRFCKNLKKYEPKDNIEKQALKKFIHQEPIDFIIDINKMHKEP